MELTKEEYWYWFVNIKKVGRKTRNKLLKVFGEPEELFSASEEILRNTGFLTDMQIYNILRKDCGTVRRKFSAIKSRGIKTAYITGDNYPDRLKNIPDPPHMLYYKGKEICSNEPAVAIVGARKCSDYGRSTAYSIASELSLYGIHIISGMAYGIDGAAQRGCIRSGGITTAVLGCGVDICYPESNIELYTMIEESGSIISEYEPGTSPAAGFFPERNRIISGLSDIVVVVEAGEKSGSLITVDCALEQGKDVYAVPGRLTDIKSRSCNMLIKNGAVLFDDSRDILDAFGLYDKINNKNVKKTEKKYYLATDEKIVYAKLGLEPKHIDRLVFETDMPVEQVMRIVLNLELRHIIRKTANNYYVKDV